MAPQTAESFQLVSPEAKEATASILMAWGKLGVDAQLEVLGPLVHDMVHNMCRGVSPEKAADIAEVLMEIYEESGHMVRLSEAEAGKRQVPSVRPEDY